MRNLFTTKTGLAIVSFAIAALASALPTIQSEVSAYVLRNAKPQQAADLKGLITVIAAISGSSLGLAAKYSSGDFYTPKGIPGKDRPD